MAGTNTKLCCIVCPKDPKFSDLSHLLTHLASKGHLSHEFTTRMAAASDPVAADKLARFEAWKAENNLNHMLNERIQAKERKKSGNRQQSRKQPVTTKQESADTPPDFHQRSLQAVGVYGPTAPIDPRLTARGADDGKAVRRSARQPVKREFTDMADHDDYDSEELEGSRQDGPAPYPSATGYHRAAMHRSIARAQDDHTDGKTHSRQGSGSSLHSSYHFKRDRDSNASVTDDTTDNPSSSSAFGADQEEERHNEYTVLKGIKWPGMAVFDAATPLAKRARNQKKASSTMVAMQAYSETIEPLETIQYYPSWEMKKTREISGQVESSDEEMAHSESKTQFKTRARSSKPRSALVQVDKNKMMKRSLTSDKSTAKSPTELSVSTLSSHGRSEPLPNLNSGMPSLWQVNHDEDLDWNLGFENNVHDQRKSGPQFFRDTSSTVDRAGVRRMNPEDDTDMFVTHTPTPKPQLPSLHTLHGLQTPTPRRVHGHASSSQLSNIPLQARHESAAPFRVDREVAAQSGLSSMANGFNSRADSTAFHDPYPQRYFATAGSHNTHFGNTVPYAMDFAIGHQQGRLPTTGVYFGSSSYGGTGFGGGPFMSASGLDNPMSMFQGRLSLSQSPARASQSPASGMNPLLDFTQFLGNPRSGADADADAFDGDV